MALEDRFRDDPGVSVVSLKGNHEQMMLDAFDGSIDAGSWWSQGGAEAADSYAGGQGQADAAWQDLIPRSHIDWMRGLGSIRHGRARGLVFVHAGIEPSAFPNEGDNTCMCGRGRSASLTGATGPSAACSRT